MGSALRRAGRVVLWAMICLLLVRGLLATAAGPRVEIPAQADRVDQAEAAFAIRFARAYLADPYAPALAGLLAEGARLREGRAAGGGLDVAQAEVTASDPLGDGRAVLTVACELRDSRTLYLAVPVVRTKAGEVAALGAPSIVAAPGGAGADPERPQPLAGPDAGEIGALVEKFLPAYVGSERAAELTYFLAPGAEVKPLGGGLDFASVSGVTQLGSGEGPQRDVLAAARLTDPATGASFPVAYRLELVRGARWYVRSVEGALS